MISLILEFIGFATVIAIALISIKEIVVPQIQALWCEHLYEVTGTVEYHNEQVIFLRCKHCGKELMLNLDTAKAKIKWQEQKYD